MTATDPRVVAAYEEALFTIARATVACRQRVSRFTVDQDDARQLLVTCEQALTGLVALGAVPGTRGALQALEPRPTPAQVAVDTFLVQLSYDRNQSAYWQARPGDLDAVEAWLLSLRDHHGNRR